MKPDLKSMTRKELEKLRADVDKALSKVANKEKKAALAAAQKAAAAHGFDLTEILGEDSAPKKTRKKSVGPKKPGVPKYRNPDDNDQTWTGKGRQPDWFKKALAAGKTPEAMEIPS
ncbi:H-NS histone family protein [Yoonia sp. 2307UL14-13]|uniref:H-NS histone family protein n=1 Tax=Yoonia sp. 2307UL14-13 TaxID=3126506 RepID=UPI0030A3F727